jgi:hypothetical protein
LRIWESDAVMRVPVAERGWQANAWRRHRMAA